MKYIYPNKPNWIEPSTVDNYKKDWIAERKKNGWRCLAIRWENKLELWTRRNTLINDSLPITRGLLELLPPNTMIDGELIDKRTKDIKDHFYAFDILFLNDQSLMHNTWLQRRKLLEKTLRDFEIYCDIAEPINIGFKTLYDLAVAEEDEGIVLKNIHSKYIIDLKDCPQNPHWLKAKRPEKCFVAKEG